MPKGRQFSRYGEAMSPTLLLTLSGGLEAIGGILTLVAPALAVDVLTGRPADLMAIVWARFFGAGMFSLGLVCLSARTHASTPAGIAVVYGITAYNVLAASLLFWAIASVGLGGGLLLAAAFTHAVFGLLFLRALMALGKEHPKGSA